MGTRQITPKEYFKILTIVFYTMIIGSVFFRNYFIFLTSNWL
jgi:hypothetical protein